MIGIMSVSIQIGKRQVGYKQAPYIIAEMSGNHNQSLDTALDIVEAAHRAGADAIKLQTFTPETLTLDSSKQDFLVPDEAKLWAGQRLWDLYTEAYTPWEWHIPIFRRARQLGLDCISTAFDDSSVDFLLMIGVDAIKIASFELIHLPLLARVAQTGLPLIVSTGMGTENEIEEALTTIKGAGGKFPILLKCTSAYPSLPKDANISSIPALRERFGTLVGISDHTLSHSVVATAVSLGACIVEKHLTIDRQIGGPDAAFSLEPEEFAEMTRTVKECHEALGSVCFGAQAVESASVWERPSIWVAREIKAGERLTTENIRVRRPGGGLHPRNYHALLGRRAAADLPAATALSTEQLEP
jgi:pseudaminic acid synthase